MRYRGISLHAISNIRYQYLEAYLRANDWKHENTKSSDYALYSLNEEYSVLVPLKISYSDYAERIVDALHALAEAERRDAIAILYDIQGIRSDRTRWDLEHPSLVDGGLDLISSIEFLEGARKAIHSLACSAIDPKPVHPRLQKAQADAFISRCRLNRSEPGSFIAYIDCPLDYNQPVNSAIQSKLFGTEVPDSFSRIVTVSLVNSLNEFRQAELIGNTNKIVEHALSGSTISTNLCDALLEMKSFDGPVNLNLSVKWGVDDRLEPLSRGIDSKLYGETTSFELSASTFEVINEVSERLTPVLSPTIREYVCYVDTLKGKPNNEERMCGVIEVSFVFNDRLLRAKISLDPDQYQKAVDAHRAYRSVLVRGRLVQGTRLHEIVELSTFENALI